MLITIAKYELNALNYACTLCDYKANLYTIESNDKMVQVEILTERGEEISVKMAWLLARQVENKLACEAFTRK